MSDTSWYQMKVQVVSNMLTKTESFDIMTEPYGAWRHKCLEK